VKDCLLATGADDHLGRRNIDPQVALEMQCRRLAQGGRTRDRGVACIASIQRSFGGGDDVRRGGEVRLAH
jgi:hypothetical protein